MERALEDLSRAEAFRLLAGEHFGRVGITIGALPAILPVSYAILDDAIVFRTSPGTKLTAAVQEAVVAFEVDHADEDDRTGWSVLVVGQARRITDAETLEHARALELRPWAPGERDHFVRISPEMVTGRRIAAAASAGASG
jgi:nitroimidazol reductase NimA-like FMN-containing flavoprotein (pyridoxamine 5'-phosphate oxidase superfamily)